MEKVRTLGALQRVHVQFLNWEEEIFGLKPMNCPGHTLIYSSDLRSYRDLPIRIADFGRLHRYEKAGVLSGLTRVRSFSQDDAHIYCTQEQMKQEIENVINITLEIYEAFGLQIRLSSFPQNQTIRSGRRKIGIFQKKFLEEALDSQDISYKVNTGEGAFYGP